MKLLSLSLSIIVSCLSLAKVSAQVSGNINYQTQVRFPDNYINVTPSSGPNLTISVKGMANVKADSYVAIFNITQTGLTTAEVNRIVDQRIEEGIQKIKDQEGVEVFVDMLSFVPVYEYEQEKKIFSKKTYNEIPAGFEIKKNIHIKYSDPELLNTIISELANAEIYDLVRVDYFSEKMDQLKKELMTKAKVMVKEKMENYGSLLSLDLNGMDKFLADGFKVVFPLEMYKSYNAYNSSSLNLKKSAQINQQEKSTTLYYQPVVSKEFDFVINPVILEPVIQIMYEIKLTVNVIKEEPVKQEKSKEYLLVTPTGEIKSLPLN